MTDTTNRSVVDEMVSRAWRARDLAKQAEKLLEYFADHRGLNEDVDRAAIDAVDDLSGAIGTLNELCVRMPVSEPESDEFFLTSAHRFMLSMAREGRLCLHRGHPSWVGYRLRGRAREVGYIPLTASQVVTYEDLIDHGWLSRTGEGLPSRVLRGSTATSRSRCCAYYGRACC
jgi:hypothetical protein